MRGYGFIESGVGVNSDCFIGTQAQRFLNVDQRILGKQFTTGICAIFLVYVDIDVFCANTSTVDIQNNIFAIRRSLSKWRLAMMSPGYVHGRVGVDFDRRAATGGAGRLETHASTAPASSERSHAFNKLITPVAP